MYDHEIIGEKMARETLTALRFDNATRDTVLTLIRYHMFDLEGKAKPLTIRRRAIKLGRENFALLIALRRADFLGSGRQEGNVVSADRWLSELKRMDDARVPWDVSELAITGEDVMREMGIAPSPQVGKVLDALHSQCVVSPALNKPGALLSRLRAMKSKVLP